MIGLLEILRARGFDPELGKRVRVKLIRHKDGNYDIETLRSTGWFEDYQRYQSKPIFDGCDQIVVTVGEKWPAARFIGIYDVSPRLDGDAQPVLPAHHPYPDWAVSQHYYPLTKRAGFEELEDRLVIDWGGSTQGWHQWLTDRPIIEIRPTGRSLAPFRDYLRVHLSYLELVRLARTADAHKDWIAGLSAVGAIYLIVNTLTGEQYVGSATGKGGLWQRWSGYAKTGHGGNEKLITLCALGAGCPEAFRFSILETFSPSLTHAEALKSEMFFKAKLGSRAFGLNAN